MIRLITGVPGAGKTLRAMHYVMQHKERCEKEGKPVQIYGNVDGADPSIMQDIGDTEWYDLPPQSLCVIDECQAWFRPASPQAQSPKRITEMEVHRHKGIDLILVTQHPKLMNHHCRRLVGKHEHITRKNNFGVVNVHSRDRAFDPDDWHEMSDSDLTVWKHPKKLFDLYKSAEVHTEVKGVPRSIKVGGGILVGGAVGLYAVITLFSYTFASQFEEVGKDKEAQQVEQTKPQPRHVAQNENSGEVLAVGGMWTENRCRLVDENGEVIDTDYNTCKNAVERGLPTRVRTDQT